jgi:2-dehydropantoate 2-reductase
MMSRTSGNPRAGIQRPSMGQDMRKGRRTEIKLMNGFIAEKAPKWESRHRRTRS